MVGGCSGGMEADEEKKVNDDVVVFMRKRSETDAPRYTARLKTYVDFQQKLHYCCYKTVRRRRAAAARRHTEYGHVCDKSAAAKKKEIEQPREKSVENNENRGTEDDRLSKRRGGEKCSRRPRSLCPSRSEEPVDACRRRRRRSRRRRSRRRRRSCRRRRRSRSRRRRRRSCRRRRRSRRRCR